MRFFWIRNAQFRNQAKVMTLSSTPALTEQSLVPTVCSVSSYNHSIAQTHTTLSSAGMQPRPVTQQDLVVSTGVPTAPQSKLSPSYGSSTPPQPRHHPPRGCPRTDHCPRNGTACFPWLRWLYLWHQWQWTMSMTQPLPCITMSHATSPMVVVSHRKSKAWGSPLSLTDWFMDKTANTHKSDCSMRDLFITEVQDSTNDRTVKRKSFCFSPPEGRIKTCLFSLPPSVLWPCRDMFHADWLTCELWHETFQLVLCPIFFVVCSCTN